MYVGYNMTESFSTAYNSRIIVLLYKSKSVLYIVNNRLVLVVFLVSSVNVSVLASTQSTPDSLNEVNMYLKNTYQTVEKVRTAKC